MVCGLELIGEGKKEKGCDVWSVGGVGGRSLEMTELIRFEF